MQLHPFRAESDDDGSLVIRADDGALLGAVWRVAGDWLDDDAPYLAGVVVDDAPDLATWTVGLYGSETEAIEAVIRWHVELVDR